MKEVKDIARAYSTKEGWRKGGKNRYNVSLEQEVKNVNASDNEIVLENNERVDFFKLNFLTHKSQVDLIKMIDSVVTSAMQMIQK